MFFSTAHELLVAIWRMVSPMLMPVAPGLHPVADVEFTVVQAWIQPATIDICGVDEIITIKQGVACDVLEEIDFEIDFAFIDANKSEYIKYFDIINPKLKKGAIITADNITSHPDKVVDFVEKIKSDTNYQVEILDLPGGLLVAYKL